MPREEVATPVLVVNAGICIGSIATLSWFSGAVAVVIGKILRVILIRSCQLAGCILHFLGVGALMIIY